MKHLLFPKLQTEAYSNTLIKLCREAIITEEDILFDLSKTEFITPLGIVLLAGTISECLEKGKAAKYRRPSKETTRRFLSGIGFNKFFDLSGDPHKIESPKVQLRRLYQIDYLLTDQIVEVFEISVNMSEGVKGSLKLALNELMTNAFDHGESRKGCYVCAQSYRQGGAIRLCIADFGVGIFKSLKKVHKYSFLATDSESIKLSVEQGVTSRVGREAGYGLNHIKRFIEVNEGKMYILSGTGKVLWDYKTSKRLIGEEQTMHFPFNGTMINLIINADREGFYFLKSDDGHIF
jgi:anti-sigma regulatory factor (Ser/Thr protein kinase)/anti-anti-sigma regulatory factor